MAKRVLPCAAVVAMVLLCTGCYYDVEAELYPASHCDTALVTYPGTIVPILQANCAVPGCHVAGGSAPGDFTTYTAVAANVQSGAFGNVLFTQRTMPPSGPLNACDLAKLKRWMDNGYPEH